MKDIFKIRKIALWALYAGIANLFAAAALLSNGTGAADLVLLVLGLALIAAFFVMGALWWRCPHCRRGFELRHGKMDKIKICPYCGEKLR